jgi:hypothetical protein
MRAGTLSFGTVRPGSRALSWAQPFLSEFAVMKPQWWVLPVAIAAAVAAPAQARMQYAPFAMVEHFGDRPVVEARIDTTPIALQVHSGASGTIEITPEAADALGYSERTSSGRYGIDRSGHLAAAGASRTSLRRLSVGPSVVTDVPAFVHALPGAKVELPGAGEAGMLGVGWLRKTRAIVDFDGKRIGFPDVAGDSAAERARLVAAGYAALRMVWDEKEACYLIDASLDGHPARLIVNTVSKGYLDLPSARAAKLKFGGRTGTAGGPGGASVPVHKPLKPVSVRIGGVDYGRIQPPAWDTGAYLSAASAKGGGPIQGALGATFWIAQKASIDFGDGWLLLAPPAPSGR